ncbi:MAG: hypothetical protein ISS26_05210 [Candidatus Omnitrophica bacterium]|nr:hypothetical protein [Candidatus Omnitrophota bacterium]
MKNVKVLIGILILILLTRPAVMIAQEPTQINSKELSETDVTAFMQQEISEGRNLLFCSAFQIAWDRLCDDILTEPLRLSGDPIAAKMLNERLTGEEDVSGDYYLAMAGYKRDNITGKIVEAMKERFNESPGIDLSLNNPDDILAYAFLLKDLKFDKEFESLERPINFTGKTPVRAFGITKFAFSPAHRSLSKQLDILDYQSDNDFVIALKSVLPEDEIILAKIAQEDTLLASVESVLSRISGPSGSKIRSDETLKIPKLDFDILHFYSDIEGAQFLNEGFEKHFIAKALQSIRFRLDEKGALLKSEAAIMAPTMMPPSSPPKIRQFIFDKPFLIMLKEKDAKYPYFAMWVSNSELLVKYK